MNLSQIMTRNVVTVPPTAPAAQAVAELRVSGLHVLPVVDASGRLLGLALERDLLEAAFDDEHSELPPGLLAQYTLAEVPIEALMRPPRTTLSPEATLEDAARAMLEHRVYGLPIVNAHGILEGVVTVQDVLRGLLLQRSGTALA